MMKLGVFGLGVRLVVEYLVRFRLAWGSFVSDFEIECCGKFLVKRFRVKPYKKGVLSEEYSEGICPKCGLFIIKRKRTCRKEDKSIKPYNVTLTGLKAMNYLVEIFENDAEKKEIFNYKVEKGCKSFSNWFCGLNNKRYDLNGKRRDFITV